jgi:tetratricopeptide (TPR) repeat protein
MGFVWLFAIMIAAAALLWRLRVARPLWTMVGAALMLGATGYALQGRPRAPGVSRVADGAPIAVDPGITQLRDDMFGARFTNDGAFLIAADAMMRSGDPRAAVQWTLAGIRAVPGSTLLWTGLGGSLARHDRQLSPAALFAFRHAMRLAPNHPGPPFFLGLAYVEAGRFAEARPAWRRALALCAQNSPYRSAIAVRLVLLDRYLNQSGAR